MNGLQKIDHQAMRTNQAVIIILLVLAFLFDLSWVVGITAFVMLAGTAFGRPGFGFLYTAVLKPAGALKPDVLLDHPQPHRFAQGFGGTVLATAAILLLSGISGLGWGLSWLVAGLAALNLFGGFCVGCAVYYWFNRLGLPGFSQTPPPGVFPGLRPKREES